MSSRDYIPNNWDAFAVWMANFNNQLPTVATKYNVSAAVLTKVGKDNEWLQYWVEARNTGKQQEKQLGDYVEGVANGNLGDPPLNDPTWALPPTPPSNVLPGIKKRIREVANGIKVQKSIYTAADGELLGIVTPEETRAGEETYTPELKLRSLNNFGVEVDFRKFGMTAIKIEVRHKGGTWQSAAFLNKSPGVFNVLPAVPDTAEQIEIRAIYMKDNANYGNFSAIYPIVIAP